MEKLLNVENDWDRILEADIVEGPCELISEGSRRSSQEHKSRKGCRTIRDSGGNTESSWKQRC